MLSSWSSFSFVRIAGDFNENSESFEIISDSINNQCHYLYYKKYTLFQIEIKEEYSQEIFSGVLFLGNVGYEFEG